MKIAKAEVFVHSPGRNFVTLRITTDDGLVGLGDATVNGRELAVAAYLRDHLAPMLIGRDAHNIEDTWQYFYRGSYWRRGPITMTAIAATTWHSGISKPKLPTCRFINCSVEQVEKVAWLTVTRLVAK